MERSLSQTTRVRIDVSTPNGMGNPFARKRFGGMVPVFQFRWKDDPRKDQVWYEGEKRRLDPVTVAQELDCDYSASIEGVCIPAAWVRAAVELPLEGAGPVVAGLDVASEGANRSVLVTRRGPLVLGVKDWGQLLTTQVTHVAGEEAERAGVTCLSYDAAGIGEGVKGTALAAEGGWSFSWNPVNVGETPTLRQWDDGRTGKDKFFNLKAELWWSLRRRFERSYQYRLWLDGAEGGVEHEPGDCLSIPNHPQLVAELSLPLYNRTEKGKIKLESKEEMRCRGVKSPDFAEALVLTEAPVPEFVPPSSPKVKPRGLYERRASSSSERRGFLNRRG